MKILIIEDNVAIAKALRNMLSDFYSVDIVHTGFDGIDYSTSTDYDTIILDLNLPDMYGDQVCHEIRKSGVKTPIIVLTGKGEVQSKVNMLGIGADDYVTKPFNIKELRARIDVAMRHISNNSPSGNLEEGDIELDPYARTVKVNGKIINLRRKEFDILEYFMRNKGQTLTRNMIIDHIWDMNDNLWANVVDVHVKHLRDKIDRPFNSKYIQTIHGVGYRFS